MTAIEKMRALNTVTMIAEDDPQAQDKIDTLEQIGARYFILYSNPDLKIGKNCIVFTE